MRAEKIRVSGFVKDAQSKEALIGASVWNVNAKEGSSTDLQSFFSILIQSPAKIQISYIGYQSQIISIQGKKDTTFSIYLQAGEELEGVVVQAVPRNTFNVSGLSIQELNTIPSITGKPDVIKALQLLPGIQSQGEGSSNLLVRGGNPGENLYLMDNIPLIYVNHLGGFFSVFNPDIINKVEVYKGGFPPKYGGKLSSVVDITQKQGDQSEIKGNLSIGLSDLSFSIEGPTKLKNSSFIVSGRKTFIDAYFAAVSTFSDANDFTMLYGFHDINAKFSWQADPKNSFHFNIYQGDDYLSYWNKGKTDIPDHTVKNHQANIWGNFLVSTHWKRIVSPRWFMDNSLSYTRYRLRDVNETHLKPQMEALESKQIFRSSVQDLSLRSNWKYLFLNNWTMDLGMQASYVAHAPNDILAVSDPTLSISRESIRALNADIYWNNRIRLFGFIDADIGFRLSDYLTRNYFHFGFEPRISIDFIVGEHHVLNASYMRVNQNSHLIFTTGNLMNKEVWLSSDQTIPTAFSDQFSLGWQGHFAQKSYSAELNIYYKTLSNLATIKEGYTSILGDAYWRSKIETGGKGTAYGLEFLFKKNIGKWKGFAAYTYSRANRQYPNINQGKTYVYEYDRPHTASLGITWEMNKNWTFSLAWIYQTGLAYTPAIERIYVPVTDFGKSEDRFYEVILYGERNSARMRDYHRLDLAANYTYQTKRNRKAIWTFSLYNAYNRQNAYNYYYNNVGNTTSEIYDPAKWGEFKPLALYQITYFPIIPMVSYKLYFGTANEKRIRQENKIKKQERGESNFQRWMRNE